ncbi:MAG: 30S ribosomal protein S6 [Candidatus Omnitrophica bacterium]|nr:30S ribosomal protein S6 [Candidatus Omnitrophota bacterium]
MNNKYEGMFIVKSDLSEDEKKALFAQIGEVITKNGGTVTQASVWGERKKLSFPIKKQQEGTYYLVNFTTPTSAIAKMREIYKINESVLRVLFTLIEK